MTTFKLARNVRAVTLFASAGAALALAACARQPSPNVSQYAAPGFLSGLLHGFIMLFSLIASIFTDVRIYNFPNSGGWYDLGYVIGAAAFFGGGGASKRRRKVDNVPG